MLGIGTAAAVHLAGFAVLGLVLIGITPAGSLQMAPLAYLLYGIGFGDTNAYMFSMQADTVDHGEWRTGTPPRPMRMPRQREPDPSWTRRQSPVDACPTSHCPTAPAAFGHGETPAM